MKNKTLIGVLVVFISLSLISAGTLVKIGQLATTGTPTATTFLAGDYSWKTITSLGTVTTGIWNGTLISPTYGGTGVNNGSNTITVSGNTSIGSSTYTVSLLATANTSTTLPTSGTIPNYLEGTTSSSSTPTSTGNARQNFYSVTALAVTATMGAPSGTALDNNTILYRFKDNGTARSLSWNSIYRAGTDFALPTTTVIGKTLYVQFVYNSADTKWDCIGKSDGF